jgi:hypothetical protein
MFSGGEVKSPCFFLAVANALANEYKLKNTCGRIRSDIVLATFVLMFWSELT